MIIGPISTYNFRYIVIIINCNNQTAVIRNNQSYNLIILWEALVLISL